MPDYNFDKYLKGEDEKVSKEEARNPEEAHRNEDVRPNHRVVDCCSNCKFFHYDSSKRLKSRRQGYCTQPNPKAKDNRAKNKNGKIDEELAAKYWLKTHSTMKCDLYERKQKYYCIDPVARWIRKPLDEDGRIIDEEDLDIE